MSRRRSETKPPTPILYHTGQPPSSTPGLTRGVDFDLEVTTMRSDTPYSDLYEKTFDVDTLAQCTVQWALWMLRDNCVDAEGRGVASRALRLAMSYRREMRDKRNLILAESFKREISDASV